MNLYVDIMLLKLVVLQTNMFFVHIFTKIL